MKKNYFTHLLFSFLIAGFVQVPSVSWAQDFVVSPELDQGAPPSSQEIQKNNPGQLKKRPKALKQRRENRQDRRQDVRENRRDHTKVRPKVLKQRRENRQDRKQDFRENRRGGGQGKGGNRGGGGRGRR